MVCSVAGSSGNIYAYLGEYHSEKYRSRSFMYASTCSGLGNVFLPVVAYSIINQQWAIYIPVLEIAYKPWRLFLLVCGLPGLLSGLALLLVPESPKFVSTQGKHKETIAILQFIHKWNGGGGTQQLHISKIIENENHQPATGSIFHKIKEQTCLLFGKTFIRTTLIACFIQFVITESASGMYMWFPGIVNRIIDWRDKNTNESTTLCNILSVTKTNATISQLTNCHMDLNAGTYTYTFIIEVSYVIGFGVLSLVIKKIGKLAVIGLFGRRK